MGDMESWIDNMCAHINAECENGCGTKARNLLQTMLSQATNLEGVPQCWKVEHIELCWTTTKPTQPGWYWYRDKSADGIVFIHTTRHGGLRVAFMNGNRFYLDQITAICEWSSEPVTPPTGGHAHE